MSFYETYEILLNILLKSNQQKIKDMCLKYIQVKLTNCFVFISSNKSLLLLINTITSPALISRRVSKPKY